MFYSASQRIQELLFNGVQEKKESVCCVRNEDGIEKKVPRQAHDHRLSSLGTQG